MATTKKHIHAFKRENHEVITERPTDVELKYVIPVDTSVQTLAELSGAKFVPMYSGDNMDMSTQDLMLVKQKLINLKYQEQNMRKEQELELERQQEQARQAQIFAEAQKIVESQKISE